MAVKGKADARHHVMVYLDGEDQALLERVVSRTRLSKTEVFRRGLRLLAEGTLSSKRPGSSFAHLVASAVEDAFPANVAEQHDEYLYGGGYGRSRRKKRAGAR